jgi:hypothetical protein
MFGEFRCNGVAEPVNGEASRYTAGALKLIARLCADAAQAVFRPGLSAAVGTKRDSVMSRRPHDFPVQVVADRQAYSTRRLLVSCCSGGQYWPKATTPVARSGVEGRQHGAIMARGKSISLEVVKQVKAIGLKHDETQQALMQEALNLPFAKYGEDQIA